MIPARVDIRGVARQAVPMTDPFQLTNERIAHEIARIVGVDPVRVWVIYVVTDGRYTAIIEGTTHRAADPRGVTEALTGLRDDLRDEHGMSNGPTN